MANEQQRHAWNDVLGPKWVAEQAIYDRMLAPFQAEVVATLDAQPGERILDIGCGYGTTSIAVAAAVGEDGHVHGVDISEPMVDEAARRAPGNCSFSVGDAQIEALGDGFDAVVSRFGVMFFDDPAAAFANIGAAVRPGGRIAFVCWQGPQQNPFFSVPGRHLREAMTNPPPVPAPGAPSPVALADPERTCHLLTEAGWADAACRPIHPSIRFDTADSHDGLANVAHLLRSSELGTLAAAQLSPADFDEALRRGLDDLHPYLADGVLTLPTGAWIVTAHRPD